MWSSHQSGREKELDVPCWKEFSLTRGFVICGAFWLVGTHKTFIAGLALKKVTVEWWSNLWWREKLYRSFNTVFQRTKTTLNVLLFKVVFDMPDGIWSRDLGGWRSHQTELQDEVRTMLNPCWGLRCYRAFGVEWAMIIWLLSNPQYNIKRCTAIFPCCFRPQIRGIWLQIWYLFLPDELGEYFLSVISEAIFKKCRYCFWFPLLAV